MPSQSARFWVLGGLALALGLGWWMVNPPAAPPSPPELDLVALLDAEADGFAWVDPTWVLALPRDHGAHPAFRGENWTLSGWLGDRPGTLYAFQLALARIALRAQPVERASAWAANQIYRAHFTLIRGGASSAQAAERVSREALGLAGSRSDPPGVWVRDWSLEVPEAGPGLRMGASAEGVALELELEPIKGALAGAELGLAGLAQERGPGGAGVHLYVLPRLEARGRLVMDGVALEVRGTAQLDHAWGALPAAGGRLAVNRLGLLLDDGRELLCIEVRRLEGGGRSIPSCALIDSDGRVQSFQRREIVLEPTERWRSPHTGRQYPVAWDLRIQPLDLTLRLTPWTADQELALSVTQWSGAIRVSGGQGGTPVSGKGRMELTGLTEPPNP